MRIVQEQVLKVIFDRKSIRKFKRERIPRETIEKIIRAGQMAPTACGMQTYSFILISDNDKREEIFRAIGRQKCMEEAPEWVMVCADFSRQLKLFEVLGIRTEIGGLTKFLQGVIDAALTAENMVIAAEAFGLGSVFIGTVWEAPKKIAEILELPKNILPIVLLCLGYSDESPPLRPRWPLEGVLHENVYKIFDESSMKKYYQNANKQLVEMKYFRKGINSWADHWQTKFKIEKTDEWEKTLLRDLKDIGFLPEKFD